MQLKLIKEDTDKEISKNSAIAIIDAFAATTVETDMIWGLIKSLFATRTSIRKDRTIEFLESIIANQKIFTEKVINTVEFQDGLVFSF